MVENRIGQISLTESEIDPNFVPWYEEGEIFKENVKRTQDWRRTHWGDKDFGVILDVALIKFRPSQVAAFLIAQRLDPSNIMDLFFYRGIYISYIQNEENSSSLRLIDGYIKEGNSLRPVCVDIPCGSSPKAIQNS